MSIRLELIRCVAGFSDSESKNQSFFSVGMTNRRGGMIPYWNAAELTSSSTVASLQLIKWIDLVNTSGINYVVGMDDKGTLYSAASGGAWSTLHCVGLESSISAGNGMITDQKGRLLYLQSRYVGMFTSALGFDDDWLDTGFSTTNDRPADTYEDWVVFSHDNTIGLINIMDNTTNMVAFELPSGFTIKSIRSGRTGVLIGANFGPKGVLALWDCLADGAIAPWIWVGSNINSICKYQGQWIVYAGNEIFITNGYTKTPLTTPPDTQVISNGVVKPGYISGMAVKDNYLIINAQCGNNAGGRTKGGIWFYDLNKKVWEICPNSEESVYGISAGALFIDHNSYIYAATKRVSATIGTKYFVDKITQGASSLDTALYVSPTLGEGNTNKTAEGLTLNFNYNFETDDYANATLNGKLTAAIYDYSRQFFITAITNLESTAATEIRIAGNTYSANGEIEVGDMIYVMEGKNAGQIGFVSSIVNNGLATMKIVLDRALTGGFTENNVHINRFPAKLIGDITLSGRELKDRYLPIKKSIQGKKFMIILHYTTPKYLMLDKLGLLYSDQGYF